MEIEEEFLDEEIEPLPPEPTVPPKSGPRPRRAKASNEDRRPIKQNEETVTLVNDRPTPKQPTFSNKGNYSTSGSNPTENNEQLGRVHQAKLTRTVNVDNGSGYVRGSNPTGNTEQLGQVHQAKLTRTVNVDNGSGYARGSNPTENNEQLGRVHSRPDPRINGDSRTYSMPNEETRAVVDNTSQQLNKFDGQDALETNQSSGSLKKVEVLQTKTHEPESNLLRDDSYRLATCMPDFFVFLTL